MYIFLLLLIITLVAYLYSSSQVLYTVVRYGGPYPFNHIQQLNKIPIFFRCNCGKCSIELLAGAREYRCCCEIQLARDKLDGAVKCITLLDGYKALTNRTVLKEVGPLLKTRRGQGYRRRGNQSENEWVITVLIFYNNKQKIYIVLYCIELW